MKLLKTAVLSNTLGRDFRNDVLPVSSLFNDNAVENKPSTNQ